MTTSANHPMAWADLGACRGEDQDLFYPPVPPEKITAAHVALARPIGICIDCGHAEPATNDPRRTA